MKHKISKPDIRYSFVETPQEKKGHQKRIEIVLCEHVNSEDDESFEVEVRLCECSLDFLENMVDRYRSWVNHDDLPDKKQVKNQQDKKEISHYIG